MDFDKDLEEKVEQLKDMKAKGLLSQEEFESMLEGLQVEVERIVKPDARTEKVEPVKALPDMPDARTEKIEPEEILPELPDDISRKVEQLRDMHKRGMISREEYNDMKAELLRQ